MSASDYAVEAISLSKSYPPSDSPQFRLRQLLFPGTALAADAFWALKDVTFSIQRGETFCVIGQNGSGKSTLLQLIASIFPPTSGEIHVNGRLAALLELGAGFNPDFTGRENVLLNGSLLGFSKQELRDRLPVIEGFAEIGHFLDQPVKTYSSGMLVRLAFAVAVHVDPELLLVDEALAVGDIYFRQRCMRKIHELKRNGTTIVYVTHSAADVRAIADRCLWLDSGSVRECGDPESVVSHYLAEMTTRDATYVQSHRVPMTEAEASGLGEPLEIIRGIPNVDHRYGDGRAKVLGIRLTNESGEPAEVLKANHEVVVRTSVQANEAIASPIVGYLLRNHTGLDLAASNTLREGYPLPPLAPGQIITVDFHLTLPELYPASIAFSVAIADGDLDAFVMCDWVENAISLQVDRGPMPVYGYVHLPCRIAINQRLGQPAPEEAMQA